jgi:O-antigen ligase
VILIGAAREIKTRPWAKALLIATVLPLLALLVRTGSRSGLVAFGVGFCACLLPSRGRSGHGFSVILLVLVVGAASLYLALRYPLVVERFQEGYAGNLAGRQMIIPASLEMISERPVFGWQPIAFWEELGRRVGRIWGVRDAHNLFFHLLLEVGILGAVPFLIGVWLCVAGAWRARNGKFGNLPFALLAMTLIANLSHTYLLRKPQWIVLAFAVAAATATQRSLARYLIRRPLRSTGRVMESPLNTGQRQF